jgi:multiple sugar transport system ATP-binding protein
MVFQSYALYPQMTVFDNIAFGLELQGVDEDVIEERVKKTAAILGLTDYLDRLPRALSGGQRQRVAIGRAIIRKVGIFLMDEPLSNLDAKLRNEMRAEIIKLRKRINTTFIYVTHDQTEAMTLGDRIVIMRDGYIQQIGTPQEVFNHPANLFVAGFIGMPVMNFFDAELKREGDKFFVQLGDYKVELDPEKEARLKKNNVQSQKVTLGVRPEHTNVGQNGVAAKVDVSEMMGSSVHLHLSAEGRDVIVIVPTIDLKDNFKQGDVVHFSFNGNVAHVFSKENDKNLEW